MRQWFFPGGLGDDTQDVGISLPLDHKILKTHAPFRSISRWIWLVLLLAVTAGARLVPWDDVFLGGQIYFSDADCYSRMTRVQRVMEHPFQRIAQHSFENFPDGTTPHTTAPMDYAIACLAWLFAPFASNPIDLAGAFVSPLLAVALVGFLWFWGDRLDLPFRNAMLALLALSPIFVHAFALGRPDHQSLTLLLVGVALAAEWSLWRVPSRGWAVLGGCAWGAALWVTLYEPLILFAAVILLRVVCLRRGCLAMPWPIAWACTAGVFLFGALVDGIRVGGLPPETVEFFPRWATLIGELRSLVPWSAELYRWCGWLLPVLPVLLVWQGIRRRAALPIAHAALLLLVFGLTLWQMRWGYFLVLVAAMSLPWALDAVRSRALAWAIFLISLLPLGAEWEQTLRPDRERLALIMERRKDNALLREAATALISNEQTPILAPWWLSPAIAYWSGQPCVAGSSHQSLPGIVDTARFYLATTATEAAGILDRRKVHYVVAYEPERVRSTSATLLGRSAPPRSLGDALYLAPRVAPSFLALVFSNDFFKVYEVVRPETPAEQPVRE